MWCVYVHKYKCTNTCTQIQMLTTSLIRTPGFIAFSFLSIILVMKASLFPVTWRMEEQRSVTLAFLKTSAPPCRTETRSSVTACEDRNLSRVSSCKCYFVTFDFPVPRLHKNSIVFYKEVKEDHLSDCLLPFFKWPSDPGSVCTALLCHH